MSMSASSVEIRLRTLPIQSRSAAECAGADATPTALPQAARSEPSTAAHSIAPTLRAGGAVRPARERSCLDVRDLPSDRRALRRRTQARPERTLELGRRPWLLPRSDAQASPTAACTPELSRRTKPAAP